MGGPKTSKARFDDFDGAIDASTEASGIGEFDKHGDDLEVRVLVGARLYGPGASVARPLLPSRLPKGEGAVCARIRAP